MGRAKKWQQAFFLIREMQHDSLEADVITYNAAMSACEKGQRWQLALQLFGELQQCSSLEADRIEVDSRELACDLWRIDSCSRGASHN